MAKVTIVIPTLNQFKLAYECINSIETRHNYRLCTIPNYKMDLPLAGCWNLGIRKSMEWGSDLTLICNDDIVFSPWTIDAMVKTYYSTGPQVAMVTGTNVRGSMGPDEVLALKKPERPYHEAENPDFACFMVSPKIVNTVGWFDETFAPAYFEDNDYHLRINLAGLNAISTTAAPYYHYGSKTQNADPNNPVVPSFAFEINKLYYINKWGGDPGNEMFERPFNDENKTFRDC